MGRHSNPLGKGLPLHWTADDVARFQAAWADGTGLAQLNRDFKIAGSRASKIARDVLDLAGRQAPRDEGGMPQLRVRTLYLQREADRRGITLHQLTEALMRVITQDRLVNAILDDADVLAERASERARDAIRRAGLSSNARAFT